VILNADGLELVRCPYYQHIPVEHDENLRWRLSMIRRAAEDLSFRDALLQMCREDVLFFLNGFCYVVEPRKKEGSKILPFVAWPHQVDAVRAMRTALGKRDIVILKSRAEGASWITLLVMLHAWLFEPMFAGGLVSKDEASADTPGNLGTLLPKLEWELRKLQPWLVPAYNRKKLLLTNLENDATISAYAATGDVGSGGRLTCILQDELAKFRKGEDRDSLTSTQAVTDCRIIVSTPKGPTGAYAEVANDETSEAIKIRMHWSENPIKNQGLYRVQDGKAIDLNAANPLTQEQRAELPAIWRRLLDRGFAVEGALRSPWYDRECLRPGATPKRIAQEQDIDFGLSGSQLFPKDWIDGLVRRTAQPPLHEGIVRLDDVLNPMARFQNLRQGAVKVWLGLGAGQRVPFGEYVVGCDIAAGSAGEHSSNSVCIVLDAVTGEQVLEYATSSKRPEQFASEVVGICRWFNNAWLNWERNGGSGVTFGRMVVGELQYPNLYLQKMKTESFGEKVTDMPGYFHCKPDDKEAFLAMTMTAMQDRKLIVRSESTIREFGEYGYDGDKVVHLRSERNDEDGATGKAHGDRAIALCMAWMMLVDRGVRQDRVTPPKPTKISLDPGIPCVAQRLFHRQQEQERKRSVSWV
jgi:hypothetical protein